MIVTTPNIEGRRIAKLGIDRDYAALGKGKGMLMALVVG